MISTAKEHPHVQCQNCGMPLNGPYCGLCGQHDIEYHRSFRHIAEDLLEGFFHFDGKLLKSVTCLFTRPGFLTLEFIAGRRVRYAHPLRLYIAASFLAFFIVALMPSKFEGGTRPATIARGGADSRSAEAIAPSRKGIFAGSTAKKSADPGSLLHRIGAIVNPRVLSSEAFSEELKRLLPETLFLCIPFFALLLMAVYMRSHRFYVDHLIFALHTQTFYLFATLIKGGVGWCFQQISGSAASAVRTILSVWIFYIIYRSFRVVYQERTKKTVFKFIVVCMGYGIIVALATLSAVLISALIVSREKLTGAYLPVG